MVRRMFLTCAALFVLATPITSSVTAGQQPDSTQQKKECVVYVTKSGKRYHKAGCSSLRYSKIALARSAAVKRGYTPCKRCSGSDCEWEGD